MTASPGAAENHVQFLGTRTFGSLDGLRAIAILGVVWHHTGPGVMGWTITWRGFIGVDLFFVISGFLIVTLLLRERRRTGTVSLRDFYARRILRIFPAYYLMLLIVGVVAFVKRGNTSASVLEDLPYAGLYLSYLVNMGPMLDITWSLSVEEHFYFVIPSLEKHVKKAIWVLLPVAYVFLSLPPFGVLPDVHLPRFFRETTFGPILLGVMAAHVMDTRRGYDLTLRLLGRRWTPLVAAVLVFIACSLPGQDISGLLRILMHWSFLVLLVTCVVREDHVLRPALTLWPLRRIGVVSYGIYLFHLIVMHFTSGFAERRGIESHAFLFVSTSVAAWGVAEASYHFYESRFLAMKSRFSAERRAQPSHVTPASHPSEPAPR